MGGTLIYHISVVVYFIDALVVYRIFLWYCSL